jgi:hypothetical protein
MKLKHYCGYQDRCHQEVKEKLYSLKLGKASVEMLLSRLIEEDYLNEERYAKAFVRGHFRQKQWGKVKIAYGLKQKRISEYNIKKAMKEIFVDRISATKDWTLSKFYSDDKTISGVGVEDEKREIKVFGETRIPEGSYKIMMGFSPKFSPHYYRDDEGNLLHKDVWATSKIEVQQKFHTKHEGIILLNVPNFTGIMIHWGATDLDSHGCYIVGSVFGKVKGRDGVLNSRKAYTDLYPKLWRAYQQAKKIGQTITITYRDLTEDAKK